MMWREDKNPTSTHDTVDLRPQPITAYVSYGRCQAPSDIGAKSQTLHPSSTILTIIAAIPNIVFYS